MKQTKFLIVSLAVALLFLGFSLGFYVTNQGGGVEIPVEAAYLEFSDEEASGGADSLVLDEVPSDVSASETTVFVQGSLENDAIQIQEVASDEYPEEVAVDKVASSPTLDYASVWKLHSINTNSFDGEYQIFAKNNARFGGETPCNTFFGEYGVVDGLTRVRGFGDTGLVCGAEEAMFLDIVSKGAFSYDEAGGLLVTSDAGVLVFSQ